MKSRLLLCFSLASNLVLVVAVCHFGMRRPESKPVRREVRVIPMKKAVAVTVTETNSEPAASTLGVEIWAQLVSPDFKVYRDRLRAVGCPEETVRDIIVAEINEQFRPRREQIVVGAQGRYWEVTAKGKKALEEWKNSLEKLNEERQALIEEVLGKDSEDEESTGGRSRTRYWEHSYAWLPAETQGRLISLELEFQKRNQAVWEEVGERREGEPLAKAQEKINALEDELTAARQRLLSPEEYLEYRRRNSPAGNWARNLPGFEATETEWRAVAQLKLEYEDALRKAFPEADDMTEAFARRYGAAVTPASAEAAEQADLRRQMQAELDAAMKFALGPGRFTEYELAGNSDYQQTLRIIERYQLSESLAKQAYELQRTATVHAEAARANASFSDEARTSALTAIRLETERALATTLGTKVFNTYQEYHGDWLKHLDQTPRE